VTAQGNSRTRLARAITARSVILAEIALGELEHVQLEDALRLVYLYGETGDPKYEPAARRYLARWVSEEKPALEDIAATACTFVERRPLVRTRSRAGSAELEGSFSADRCSRAEHAGAMA